MASSKIWTTLFHVHRRKLHVLPLPLACQSTNHGRSSSRETRTKSNPRIQFAIQLYTLSVHCPSEKTKFIYPMTHLPLTCQADRPLAIPNCERCNNKIYKQIGHDIMNIPVLKNSGIQLRIIQSIKFKLPIRKMFD